MSNAVLCVVIAFGRGVQKLFLGQLRTMEQKKLNEKLVNFLLFKLMFVAAMLEHGIGHVALWTTWITFAGFMKSFGSLGRDRLEYCLNGEFWKSSFS